jgi:DNA topoisomerase VI B subunit
LTADQRVLVEREGRIERTPIGRLVDGILDASEEVRDVRNMGLRVPAFDSRTFSYAWRPVSHVIRHPRQNEILEVRTENGKRVRVTGCHSLFTYDPKTRQVGEVEARTLRPGDYLVAPRRLSEPRRIDRINLLDHLDERDVVHRSVFVYGLPFALLRELHERAEVIHKKDSNGRSRRYFRFMGVDGAPLDILDDSWLQYLSRGFLPVWLVKRLGVERRCADGYLRTYRHGVPFETTVTWKFSASLMRFLGLYVAEGHGDRRQVGFTFCAKERELVDEVVRTAQALGLSTTVEPRPRNAVRIKVFGGMTHLLLPSWCGRGAMMKRVPWFVFHAGRELRQHFLDGLYLGDGHRVKNRDSLMLSSVSRDLIADVEVLWLLQGVVASRIGPSRQRGLGRLPSIAWKLDVYGSDITTSNGVERRGQRKNWNRYRMFPGEKLELAGLGAGTRVAPEPGAFIRAAGLGLGPAGLAKSHAIIEGVELNRTYRLPDLSALSGARVTRHLTNHMVDLGYLQLVEGAYAATTKVDMLRSEIEAVCTFTGSDLCLLRVRDVRLVQGEHPFVYDLSVPGCENFVAGEGPLACHNSRGQQGIGISAAGMYGQLTTGKPILITSRTGPKRPAHHFSIQIDTTRNQPVVVKDDEVDWGGEHGTRVELEIEATYKKGRRSVDGYIEMTPLANPHATITYHSPKGEVKRYERAANDLPREPKEIKPHPHGIELGVLMKMLKETKARNVHAFLTGAFSRVSAKVADEILAAARIDPRASPGRVHRDTAEALFKAIATIKIMAPPTNCLSPIGQELILAGLKQQVAADFFTAVTRPPAVYRGNPFQVEVGLAYGGPLPADELSELVRFANRVPLLYQQSACAITRAVLTTSWRSYGIQQAKGALPTAPMLLMVHIASAWVPFTSESKEAIASYPEILKDVRLALQECGRRLGAYIRRGARERAAELKRSYIEKYIPHIGIALKEILKLSDREETRVVSTLTDTLERSRTV